MGLVRSAEKRKKLETLGGEEGFGTVDELLGAAAIDSVSPGICRNLGCSYTTEVEPDQDRGWCERCGHNTVVSALMLAGLI
ncbi:MAG TPA: hypothetical protein VF601_15510 [Beijerinckiaceae bacterium]|jgi:hypothetical protein